LHAGQEVGAQVCTEKSDLVHVHVSPPDYIASLLKVANKFLENVAEFKYLGTVLTN
jgi:hypothetical protein